VFVKPFGTAWRTIKSPAERKSGEPLGEPVRLCNSHSAIAKWRQLTDDPNFHEFGKPLYIFYLYLF
jgi:hypothetical protein